MWHTPFIPTRFPYCSRVELAGVLRFRDNGREGARSSPDELSAFLPLVVWFLATSL
jgi:hypothetical protein